MEKFIKTLKVAKLVSTPLVVVRTSDPASTVRLFETSVMPCANRWPMIRWDIARGLVGINELGLAAIAKAVGNESDTQLGPAQTLGVARKFPEHTVLFLSNAHRFFDDIETVQAIYNLRDPFKKDNRMLVLLTIPGAEVPPEISDHSLVMDEPLPTATDLRQIVGKMVTFAQKEAKELPAPSEEQMNQAVDALVGLPAFPAEQATVMSLTMQGLDLDQMWSRKVKAIELTKGLSVWKGGETFADIGGAENAKRFLKAVLKRRSRPRAIVFIDEIEKAFAGTGTDTSGVKTEMTGTMLTWMQDHNADGVIFVGPPGTAKSALAKAAGNEAGIPTIAFDLAGMQGSLVGESGRNLRATLNVVEAVSQGQALFIVTCNAIGTLPPELRRRFTLGTFFFDLPSPQDQEAIWNIYLEEYGLSGERPEYEGWTGAEIKTCCRNAYELGISLKEAAQYIVPISISAADQIQRLRTQASGKFLDAAKHGIYRAHEIESGSMLQAGHERAIQMARD